MEIKTYLHSACKRLFNALPLLGGVGGVLLLIACYSNNCPMENTVLCNYHFYDIEGTPISYGDEITVTTLMPGEKTVYTYKKLGERTIESDDVDSVLINSGYTMSQSVHRNDTVLINKLAQNSKVSIPMSYFRTSDTLVVAYASIVKKDTIIIEKESYAHVDLPECGAHQFHTLRSIRCHGDAAIDRVEIVQPDVNYEGAENVRIYFNGMASD